MLTKKWQFVGVFTLLSLSWALAAPPAVDPTTGAPLVLTCLRGTPTAIDGDLSDWNLDAMTPAVLNAPAQIYTGAASWTGPADLSGKFYVMWDDKNIYFAVIVKDDVLVADKTGADIWNADCVEIFFGTTNTAPVGDHSQHSQWGFNFANQKWNWENLDGGAGVDPPYLQVATKRTTDGYICEAAMNYSGIHTLKIAAGNTIGFHCVLDDTDAAGGDREIQMTWTGREAHDQSLGFGYLVFSSVAALPKGVARNPIPASKATDVPVDTVLSWDAGTFAASHDVYFGTSLNDVNNASRAKPAGLLASQGQTGTTFDPPGLMAYGQTYYWRVDEVNKAPDGTIYKGAVWSFTTEPYAYPITNLTATASSAQPSMGPEKTIDGSGLTADLHGTDGSTMWMSTGTVLPNWIQYQFDKAYKLWDLKVWNSNQPVEAYVGFGAKDVKVEYSTDGTTWTALANVPQFARAPGLPDYAANTTVSFGGVLAKYVKLTINATWGGMSTMTGLSEVRFSYVPTQAFGPQPATGATGLGVNTTLSWRAGRAAASHKVFFGTDQAAVTNGTASAKTITSHAFDPGALNYGTTYYWKVDEVNTVTYPGDVWSFTTLEWAVVDDFESYNDKDNCIFDAWIDGYTDKKSGSTVGYLQAPFAEQTIVHGGVQSMPLAYDNSKSPFYSETTRDLGTAQDWTGNGATHMDLWFRGYPSAAAAMTVTGAAMTLTGDGTDIWNNADDFTFAYKSLTGDGSIVARVVSIGAGTNTWAKGGVMIRGDLTAGSTFVDMCMTANTDGTAGNGASFQYRLTAAGACANTDATAAIKPPYWVKIQRTGSQLAGYVSANGTTWTQMGTTQLISMNNPVDVGICVTSHQAGEQRTFQFDNLAATGNVTGSWQALQINSSLHNASAGMYVVVTDNAGKTKLSANADPAATNASAWTQWTIPLSDLTAAGLKTTKIQKITIGVGNKTSPAAGGTGIVFIDDIGFGHPVK